MKIAVVLSIICSIGGLIFILAWPDLEDRGAIFSVSIVLAALLWIAVYFLWIGSRLGAIATLVLHAVNILLAIPAFFSAEPELVIVNALYTGVSVGAIALLLTAPARAFWGGEQSSLAA